MPDYLNFKNKKIESLLRKDFKYKSKKKTREKTFDKLVKMNGDVQTKCDKRILEFDEGTLGENLPSEIEFPAK